MSGAPSAARILVPMSVGGADRVLSVAAGIVTVDAETGSGGVIAGALSSTELSAAAHWISGACPGDATFEVFRERLEQSADLVLDAPGLQDERRACDAVSIGLGFTMKPTGAPDGFVDAPPTPDACAAEPKR